MKTKGTPKINWRAWIAKTAVVFIIFALVLMIGIFLWVFALTYKHCGGLSAIQLVSITRLAFYYVVVELKSLITFFFLVFGIASVVLGFTFVEEKVEEIPQAPPTGPITPPCAVLFEYVSAEGASMRDSTWRKIEGEDGEFLGSLSLDIAAHFQNAVVSAFKVQLFKAPLAVESLIIVAPITLNGPTRYKWATEIQVDWKKIGQRFFEPRLLVIVGEEGAVGELETGHLKAFVEITTCGYLACSFEFFDHLVVKVTLTEKGKENDQ